MCKDLLPRSPFWCVRGNPKRSSFWASNGKKPVSKRQNAHSRIDPPRAIVTGGSKRAVRENVCAEKLKKKKGMMLAQVTRVDQKGDIGC